MHPKTERASVTCRAALAATACFLQSQPQPEGAASKARVSSRTDSVVLIDTATSYRPFRLPPVKAQMPAETVTLKRADDTNMDDFAARQAAILTPQALCRLEGVLPPRSVSGARVLALELLAAMAQLGRARAEQEALEAKQRTSQKALFVAAKVFHDAVSGLSRQQHKISGLVPGTASIPANRLAAQGPSGRDGLVFFRPSARAHRMTRLHPTSV